jgi:hypothetical protein
MKPKPEDFRIDKCDDCIRITRIDNDKDMHTHLHSRRLAKVIIQNVCNEKIPLNSHTRTLECMSRLTMNEKYKNKIEELLSVRRNKSKQNYFNPVKKM